MYYDLIIRIKNAEIAEKESLRVPFSKMDLAIVKILVAEGYLKSGKKKTIGRKHFIDIDVPTGKQGEKMIEEIRFISTPGSRTYRAYRDLKPVKQGYGFAIVSTSAGVLTSNEARKRRIGGEYLFEIR